MADVPVFLYLEERKGSKVSETFLKDTKADIQAVLDLLMQRGMWSEYHYKKWSAELKACGSEEVVHLWWDAITTGTMFETESKVMEMIEGQLEAAEEIGEEKVKMKASKFSQDGMGPKKCGAKMGDKMSKHKKK